MENNFKNNICVYVLLNHTKKFYFLKLKKKKSNVWKFQNYPFIYHFECLHHKKNHYLKTQCDQS